MTKNRTRTLVYLDPGMHSGLEVKGLILGPKISSGPKAFLVASSDMSNPELSRAHSIPNIQTTEGRYSQYSVSVKLAYSLNYMIVL